MNKVYVKWGGTEYYEEIGAVDSVLVSSGNFKEVTEVTLRLRIANEREAAHLFVKDHPLVVQIDPIIDDMQEKEKK